MTRAAPSRCALLQGAAMLTAISVAALGGVLVSDVVGEPMPLPEGETPVLALYRRWRAYRDWLDSPATRGMPDDEYQAALLHNRRNRQPNRSERVFPALQEAQACPPKSVWRATLFDYATTPYQALVDRLDRMEAEMDRLPAQTMTDIAAKVLCLSGAGEGVIPDGTAFFSECEALMARAGLPAQARPL